MTVKNTRSAKKCGARPAAETLWPPPATILTKPAARWTPELAEGAAPRYNTKGDSTDEKAHVLDEIVSGWGIRGRAVAGRPADELSL